jgi:asparagine synthase (glutamine-hydrolysing)
MYEIHGYFDHHGERIDSQHFRECWSDDRLARDTVSAGSGMLYIDRYEQSTSPIDPYTIHDELCIGFAGQLHEVDAAFRQQTSVSLSAATTHEILATAYRTFGWTFPSHLLGDYHVVIIDNSRQRLVAGRDHTTADPIYFAADNGATLVSTDIAALAHDRQASVNDTYLGQFLTGVIESAQETFYTGVFRIPPGCVLVASADEQQVRRYYQPSPDNRATYRSKSRAELGDILRSRLEEAITCRLSPTETTGVMMSGGADSTAIAGLASGRAGYPPIKTYSYLHPNTTAINEKDGIEAVVSKHTLHNEQISLDDYWVLKDKPLYERAWSHAPAVDPLLQPKDALLQRAAGEGVETMLVGDNGNMLDGHRLSMADALKAGHYLDAIRTARTDPVYTTLASLVQHGLLPLLPLDGTDGQPPTRVQDPVRSRLTDQIRTQIEACRRSPRLSDSLQTITDQALYRSLTSPLFDYLYDIFRKVAKCRGIRVVDPYQDVRLVDFMFNLPPTYNVQQGYDKAIFRTALDDILPGEILMRRKTERVDEQIAAGLRRETDYLTGLLAQPHLKHAEIICDQYSMPEISTAIDAFGTVETTDIDLWPHLSAQAWLTHR